MRDRCLRLIAATALGAAAAIALLVTVAPTPIARAVVYNRYVAVTGRDDTDCSEITLPCLTPQYAINEASPGDVIKIAAGTYSTVTTNAFTTTSAYSFTQIAFISKTLTIQGGYTLTNWTTADPAANPTVFDAHHAGRGITVLGSGTEAVTVSGLTLTNGDYTGLGTCRNTSAECGGGLYGTQARLTLSEVTVANNIASRTTWFSYGGGIALDQTTDGSLLQSITVTQNYVGPNETFGGGLALFGTGNLTITHAYLNQNSASAEGGAISVEDPVGGITIADSRVTSNAARNAAAVRVQLAGPVDIVLDRVSFTNNLTSAGDVIAVGAYGPPADSFVLRNVLIAGTSVTFTTPSAGLIKTDVGWAEQGRLDFSAAHITAINNEGAALLEIQAQTAPNQSGVFSGTLSNILVIGLPALFLPQQSGPSQIHLTADHSMTQTVPALTTSVIGAASITMTQPITGAPLLDAQYRPQAFSAAINAGRDLGVAVDLSGAPRDYWPDIGAYEAPAGTMTRLLLPALQK